MKISDFLAATDVRADIGAPDKKKLLSLLASDAATRFNLSGDRIAAALIKREELGSTGVGGGVAIPHARFTEAKAPLGVLVRLKKAIDYDAVDSKPVDIVFLLLLPDGAGGDKQLGSLAATARKLRDPAITAALRHARDGAEMYRVLTAE